jgi:Cu(I)/Ag(I) efflux system membrane fusion protein
MNRRLIIAVFLALASGLGIGYWLAAEKFQPRVETTPAPRQPLYYRSPMDPAVTSPVPRKDPMGMDYVPVYADQEQAAETAPGTVRIDPVTEQNIGVRTAVAGKETLSHVVRAVGRVAYDEDLLSIYSPQLVASQQEYILALNNLKALEQSPIEDIRRGAEELVKSSRERLKLLDVPAHQLHDLTRTHEIKKTLHIHTPAAGIVMNIGVREGQYVTPATELYMIANLSTVWVYADIYEYELPWVQVGDRVEMRLAGIPGRVFEGHLAYIYPYAEPKTRTIKVRLAFDNPELLLKPDMFAEVTIFAGKKVDAVTIPAQAVIRSGARNQVFVVRAPGKFEPRTVTLGLASNGKVALLEGLEAGEKVVTSAQFLLDSESKLREVTTKMREPDEPADLSSKPLPLPTPKNSGNTDGEAEPNRHEGHRHD